SSQPEQGKCREKRRVTTQIFSRTASLAGAVISGSRLCKRNLLSDFLGTVASISLRIARYGLQCEECQLLRRKVGISARTFPGLWGVVTLSRSAPRPQSANFLWPPSQGRVETKRNETKTKETLEERTS